MSGSIADEPQQQMTAGYLLRRLLAVVLVLFIVTFAVFAVTMILPGNAAIMILGEYGTDEAVAALERQLGLDRPWYTQYADWVGGILRGDLGQSLRLSLPVSEVVGDAFWNSAALGPDRARLGHHHRHSARRLLRRSSGASLPISSSGSSPISARPCPNS